MRSSEMPVDVDVSDEVSVEVLSREPEPEPGDAPRITPPALVPRPAPPRRAFPICEDPWPCPGAAPDVGSWMSDTEASVSDARPVRTAQVQFFTHAVHTKIISPTDKSTGISMACQVA